VLTELSTPTEFFNGMERGGRLAFFTRADILLSEILWSFWSTESRYRIPRDDVFVFLTRTDTLL